MNLKAAKAIVKMGVIPGEFDSADVARAKGFLEAAAHAEILVKALEELKSVGGCLGHDSEEGAENCDCPDSASSEIAIKALHDYKSKMGLGE